MWAVLLAVTQMDSLPYLLFDNGGDQVSSDDAMQFSKYSVLIVFLSLGTSHDTINNKIVMPSGFISFYSLICISISVA